MLRKLRLRQKRWFPYKKKTCIQEHLFCTGSMSGWFLKHQCAFLRTPFFTKHLQWLILTVSGFQPATFQTLAEMFICEFCKIFKNIFWQNNSGWLLLVFIFKFWEVFQITSFIEHACGISTTRYSNSQVLFRHFIQEQEVGI